MTFQTEIAFLGIRASPSFVREPEANDIGGWALQRWHGAFQQPTPMPSQWIALHSPGLTHIRGKIVTPHAELLEIYRVALSTAFGSFQDGTEDGELLPQVVLQTLSSHLRADGGNFSLYRADGDYLDVRGWYCLDPGNIGLDEFRKKLSFYHSSRSASNPVPIDVLLRMNPY